jgi:hypothetical protein
MAKNTRLCLMPKQRFDVISDFGPVGAATPFPVQPCDPKFWGFALHWLRESAYRLVDVFICPTHFWMVVTPSRQMSPPAVISFINPLVSDHFCHLSNLNQCKFVRYLIKGKKLV